MNERLEPAIQQSHDCRVRAGLEWLSPTSHVTAAL